MMIVSFASVMVVLEKCGSSLADLHNTRGFESKILCTLTFNIAKTPLVTCRSALFDVKTNYFYYFIYSLFFIFILFLYYYYFFFFIILVFCQGSEVFRVSSVGFRVVPTGSGRFRYVQVGSSFYIHPSKSYP